MTKRRLRISVSLDGFSAGPDRNAGLVDEMVLYQVPLLLDAGERLFDGVSDLRGLVLVDTVVAPNVTHLKFAR